MPDVSVIIVNYNGQELLDDCLESVIGPSLQHSSELEVEAIVVDNASTDDSLEHLQRKWGEAQPSVRVIALPENRGFAAGNNAGFVECAGTYVLLLNSDARMLPGALERMIAYAKDHPHCGQIGPKLLNTDGSLQRSVRGFPSIWNLATEYLYLRRLFPQSRRFNDFYKGWFDHSTVLDNDGFLMGACLLVPRSALLKVGAMDESYFMFNEETDWAWRFLRAGLNVTFIPDAECTHLGGGSTRKEWDRMYRSQVEGNLRFLSYHRGLRSAQRARRLMIGALTLRSAVYSLLGRLPLGGHAAQIGRRERAGHFWSAARHIKSVRVDRFGSAIIPPLS